MAILALFLMCFYKIVVCYLMMDRYSFELKTCTPRYSCYSLEVIIYLSSDKTIFQESFYICPKSVLHLSAMRVLVIFTAMYSN